MTTRRHRTIGSLQRAIDILDLFDEQSIELGITEMSEALGLHKSTAAGLVYTLEDNGYLDQDVANRKYRLGFKLLERAFTLLDQIDVREAALPRIQELRDWCDESVNLAVRDGGQVVYIENLRTTRSLGMRSKVGYRAHMHSTALGKAILAELSQREVEQVIAEWGLVAFTNRTLTDRERFLEELVQTRQRGFAIDDEENEMGVRCVAAPIFDHTGQPVAAVSVSGPLLRFSLPELPRYGEKVREAALAISRSLGYRLQR
jgi:IclR family KDG regulon transcriptional repressor